MGALDLFKSTLKKDKPLEEEEVKQVVKEVLSSVVDVNPKSRTFQRMVKEWTEYAIKQGWTTENRLRSEISKAMSDVSLFYRTKEGRLNVKEFTPEGYEVVKEAKKLGLHRLSLDRASDLEIGIKELKDMIYLRKKGWSVELIDMAWVGRYSLGRSNAVFLSVIREKNGDVKAYSGLKWDYQLKQLEENGTSKKGFVDRVLARIKNAIKGVEVLTETLPSGRQISVVKTDVALSMPLKEKFARFDRIYSVDRPIGVKKFKVPASLVVLASPFLSLGMATVSPFLGVVLAGASFVGALFLDKIAHKNDTLQKQFEKIQDVVFEENRKAEMERYSKKEKGEERDNEIQITRAR